MDRRHGYCYSCRRLKRTLRTHEKNNSKQTIYITEYKRDKTGGIHQLALPIVEDLTSRRNLGSICLGHKKEGGSRCIHLDLQYHRVYKKNPKPYLIGEISVLGGDFRGDPTSQKDLAIAVGSGPANLNSLFPNPGCKALRRSANAQEGESACWGGTAYESWRAYEKAEHAVAYLKQYFDVQADPGNKKYDQAWINAC